MLAIKNSLDDFVNQAEGNYQPGIYELVNAMRMHINSIKNKNKLVINNLKDLLEIKEKEHNKLIDFSDNILANINFK